jgi:hypothetical protein
MQKPNHLNFESTLLRGLKSGQHAGQSSQPAPPLPLRQRFRQGHPKINKLLTLKTACIRTIDFSWFWKFSASLLAYMAIDRTKPKKRFLL